MQVSRLFALIMLIVSASIRGFCPSRSSRRSGLKGFISYLLNKVAIPCPSPTHIVAMPVSLSLFTIS